MSAERPSPRLLALGDRTLLVEFGTTIDVALNARALALAAGLAERRVAGVRDIVPAFAAVAVHFDPLRVRLDVLEAALEDVLARTAHDDAMAEGPLVELPCCYGGAHGPDLPGVASWAKCSEATVIARHASREYRVCMIGFLPGFPYLAEVDASIAAPRHPTPRLRVRAGSVGIAGRQTGVYPVESPGGWQIIGRTPVPLFDTARTPPSRLVPGARVRFVPIAPEELERHAREGTW
jgi:KipI family sensor histidine kinase inhibitor